MALHIGAVAFIHRFGSSLNGHVHFHVCVVDGVFEEVAGHAQAHDEINGKASPPSVIFHPATAIDKTVVTQAQTTYRCSNQRSEPTSDKRDTKVDELHLTPLELIDRIAALVPPPRTHRHRYFGVLAPNSPLRAAVTAMAASTKFAVYS